MASEFRLRVAFHIKQEAVPAKDTASVFGDYAVIMAKLSCLLSFWQSLSWQSLSWQSFS